MLNPHNKSKTVTDNSLKALFISGIFIFSSAHALNVNNGVFIQTIHSEALEQSANMTVDDFFDADTSSSRLFNDLENDIIFGPSPLSFNTFNYSVNPPTLNIPNRTTQPSNFSYDPNDLTGSANGAIGLGGVMRLNLPQDRFFLLGDWTIEYDESRKNNGSSGWFMRNLYQIPAIGFDILNEYIIMGPDSFFLSGELGWSPEFTTGFSATIPESETHRVIADFVLCAQDDDAVAANTAQQIPCVFPKITINGQMKTVNVISARQSTLAVDLGIATRDDHPNADYFAAFIYEGRLYWLNQNMQWTTTPSAAYQGALENIRSIQIPSPSIDFPSGTTVPFYFGVDTNANGIFDEPYRYNEVTMQIN